MQGFSRAALASGLLVACAGGTGGGESPPPMIQMTGVATTGDDDASTTEDSAESSDTSDGFTTTGPSPSTEDSGTETTASPETSESSSGGGGMMCSNLGTCNTAPVLGIVSGDEGSPILHTSGSEPTWLTFRVTENSDSLAGESLSFTATLTSPPGYDFDIYAFRGSDGGTTGCGGVTDESTATGQVDIVSMTWGEGGVANGGDESAWIALQIEVKGGVCDPTAEWSLDVEGDT